jgi:hypothetical protein
MKTGISCRFLSNYHQFTQLQGINAIASKFSPRGNAGARVPAPATRGGGPNLHISVIMLAIQQEITGRHGLREERFYPDHDRAYTYFRTEAGGK